MEKLIVRDSIKINHPLADKISVQNSLHHYASQYTSEVAFFYKDKFQTIVLKEFADYADGIVGGDTLVYGYVPNDMIELFLNEHRV